METIKEIADRLDGREYGNEMDDINELALKEHGIVIVFGYSDDNVEFRGAINDEVSCYGGDTVKITPNGLLQNECDDEYCPYFQQQEENANTTIEVIEDEGDYYWTYKTSIPHETFDIMEDGDKYCRGIVFKLSDVE